MPKNEEETHLHHKLLIAVIVGNLDWVKQQVKEGRNLSLTDEYGATIFHFIDNLEIAEYLYAQILEKTGQPPDLRRKDVRGCTPLDYISTKDPVFGKIFEKFIEEKSHVNGVKDEDSDLVEKLDGKLKIGELDDLVDKELNSEVSKALNSDIGVRRETGNCIKTLRAELIQNKRHVDGSESS